MKFKYFQASENEMRGLKAGMESCDICNRIDRVFDLQRACGSPFDKNSRKGKNGCYGCLQDGRFGFFHITELGFIDENGLHQDYDAEPEARIIAVGPDGTATSTPGRFNRQEIKVTPQAIKELWQTPDFPTWNEVSWPVHCEEFMTFLGEWKPANFSEGRKQFVEMTDRDFHQLWPADLSPPENWGIAYFAFRCPACGTHRGQVDFS